jgi:iron complex outermembrane receptor protein
MGALMRTGITYAGAAGLLCISGAFGLPNKALADTNDVQVETVTVTAERREENIQDVGATINAFSGEQLQEKQIESPHDLMFTVPSLVVSYSQGSNIPNFALRGVGLYDFAPNNSSPVAVQLDDVYQAYSAFLNFGLFDTNRIEVLKGPQGTLYGRNTTAGSVNIFSNAPTQDFGAGLNLSYGNYNSLKGDFFVNGGLTNDVSARLAGFFKWQGGGPWYNDFYKRSAGRIPELWGLRGQVLFEPNSDLSILLNIHGGRENSESAQYDMLPALNKAGTAPCPEYLNGTLKGGEADCYDLIGNQKPNSNPFHNNAGLINTQQLSSYGVTLHADYKMSWATLTSVSGFDHLDRYTKEDADGFPQALVDDFYKNRLNQYSEELRLASVPGGPVQWVFGGVISHDEINTPLQEADDSAIPVYTGLGFNASYLQKTDSEAIFGHADWAITDQLTLVGGLRYTHERRSFDGQTDLVISSGIIGQPGTPLSPDVVFSSLDTAKNFSDLSWTAGVNFKTSDDLMLYFNASKGFKSGGFNGNLTFADPISQFGKETLVAYEVGEKATLFDGSVLWDTSLFHYDYHNLILQVGFTTCTPGCFTVFKLINGADATMNGAESDFTWRAAPGLDLQAGLAWLDPNLFNSPDPNINNSVPAYAPKWSGTGSVRYEHPVSQNFTGSIELDGAYKGNFFERVPNSANDLQKAYWIFNAKAELQRTSSNWAVSLWAQNLTDTRYVQYNNDIHALGYVLKTEGYPRTYGVEVSFNW